MTCPRDYQWTFQDAGFTISLRSWCWRSWWKSAPGWTCQCEKGFSALHWMFVNGILRRHNSSRALTTREKEMVLWREKAQTTADSDWPSDAPTHPNHRQRVHARGTRRSQGRVARRAACQICRWREKEGMITFSECLDFFRRFAQRVTPKRRLQWTLSYLTPLQFEKPLLFEHLAQSLDFQYIFVPLIWKTSEICVPLICVWYCHGYWMMYAQIGNPVRSFL